jgi:protein-tyrosine phosphatase
VTSRARDLAGSFNVRDLGGLPAADGAVVRPGLVFRSDYPAFAVDPALVRQLGLRTVVDLRRGAEAAVECISWSDHGIVHHRCPITAFDKSSWEARYVSYLEDRPAAVVEAVRHVLAPANQPVLFHCAAGKDRTGLIAALVLSVLGVPDHEIVDDYVATAATVDQVADRLRGIPLYRDLLARIDPEQNHPHPAHMEALLAWLAAYGGAERWLLDHGLAPEEVTQARTRLLEPLD